MEIKYYIPIQSTSLPHYLAGACICPANYYVNKPKDIQDSFPNVILLTSNIGYNQCNCCLEIILTSEEKEFLVSIDNGYYLIDKILPISRICKILFSSEEQKKLTVSLIRQATAFIPNNIIGEIRMFENKEIRVSNRPSDFEGIKPENMQAKIKRFDSFLGALALMRIAKQDDLNFSPNYIDAVSFFNTLIRDQKETVRPINRKLDIYFHEYSTNTFSRLITEDLLNAEARKNNVQIKKNPITGIIDTESLKWPGYGYAILYTYGVADEAKRKKIDELILNNFQKNIKQEYAESVAFFYGYNRGYTVFNNEYLKDNKSVDVKFRLDNQLDYYVIESVYQYVFNGKTKGEFPYIDYWCSKQKSRSLRTTEYLILDTIVRDQKKVKVLSEEWWKQLLPGFLKIFNPKINFLGKEIDFSIDIEKRILRPFAEHINKELREEVKEEYTTIINDNKILIDSLRQEISEYKNQVESLKNKSYKSPNAPAEGSDMVAEPNAKYDEAININVRAVQNTVDVKKIINEYESLKKQSLQSLKDMIKEKYPYCSLTKKKKDELIYIILDKL